MKGKTLLTSTALCTLLCAPVFVSAQDNGASSSDQSTQSQSQQQPGMSEQQPGSPGSSQTSGDVQSMQISQLEGKNITNLQGDNLGSIDKIVKNQQDNSLQAVVSTGGFLGVGGKQVTIPVSQLQMQNDKLVWNQSVSQDQLKQQPAYDQAQYQDVDKNQTVAQAEGGATGGAGQASFASLDTNQDGYISAQEAQADPQLSTNFSQADQNSDNQIDQSEFSAFEESSQGQQPGAQQPSEQPMQPENQPSGGPSDQVQPGGSQGGSQSGGSSNNM